MFINNYAGNFYYFSEALCFLGWMKGKQKFVNHLSVSIPINMRYQQFSAAFKLALRTTSKTFFANYGNIFNEGYMKKDFEYRLNI